MSIMGDIGRVIGLVSKAKEIADKLKNLELKEVIVDLQSKLLDPKEEINNLREANLRLAEQVKMAPVAVEASKETPTIKHGVYYKGEDGPFCTACYDSDHNLVRVTDATHHVARLPGIRYRYPVCKAEYT
jgi:hypothetical protein